MQVKLLAFASAAHALGWREMLAECAASDSPRAVFASVAPGFDPCCARAAVDCEYHSWDEPIGMAAQELAILPAVSGG